MSSNQHDPANNAKLATNNISRRARDTSADSSTCTARTTTTKAVSCLHCRKVSSLSDIAVSFQHGDHKGPDELCFGSYIMVNGECLGVPRRTIFLPLFALYSSTVSCEVWPGESWRVNVGCFHKMLCHVFLEYPGMCGGEEIGWGN